jgi:hypothetical protein
MWNFSLYKHFFISFRNYNICHCTADLISQRSAYQWFVHDTSITTTIVIKAPEVEKNQVVDDVTVHTDGTTDKNQQTPWLSVRKRNMPSDDYAAGEVMPNFAVREPCAVGVTDPSVR